MSRTKGRKAELADKAVKVRSAQKAAAAPGATVRDKADLKLIEQDFLGEKLKAKHRQSVGGTGAAASKPASKLGQELDRKLDSALNDSFPGSDPVSFVESSPVKETDSELPAVKGLKARAKRASKDK